MPNSNPLVSVTICCYNSERYIAEAVRSVLDQTFEDFELIVVNDGSTDRTEEIVLGFSADPRLRYEYQTNQGLWQARNRTLELARGKYVAFLDHDDLWLPEKLALQVAVMEARDEVAAVYGDAITIDERGRPTYRPQPRYRPRDGNLFADLLDRDFINWQTVMIRRTVLDAVGSFRPYKITEDYEMLLRCAVHHPFVGIDQVLAKYRWHGANTSRRLTEALLECIEIREYWLDHLPSHHKAVEHDLRRWLGDKDYWIGRAMCVEGNTRAGREWLAKARETSSRKMRSRMLAALAKLLGDDGLRTFAVLLRRMPIASELLRTW